MAEAQIAVYMLEHIWRVGKMRYVERHDPSAQQVPLRFYDQTPLKKILDTYLDGDVARLVIKTMSMDVGYEWRTPLPWSAARAEGGRETAKRRRADVGEHSPTASRHCACFTRSASR